MIHQIILMAGPGAEQNPVMQFLPFVLIIVVFYFFMIRPQMKRAKEAKKFRESLQKGDKVVTIGGIHGKIAEIEETTLIIEMVDKARIRVSKEAISQDSSVQLGQQK